MRKLKTFSKIDLIVVVGLVLVLFGASLTVLGKTLKKNKDTALLADAAKIFNFVTSYRDNNFGLYPVLKTDDLEYDYNHVELSSADANFLQISLGSKYTSLIEKIDQIEDLVYVYKIDGSEASLVVRKLQASDDKCNTKLPDAPEIIKDYLIKDPSACYYFYKR